MGRGGILPSIAGRFILWAVRRTKRRLDVAHRMRVVTFGNTFLFSRFQFLWPDEFISGSGRHFYRPPWYRPFNAFLHCWRGGDEEMHDHPRWSITVCLRGMIIEKTPWGERELTPGSIVIRSRKAIHAFRPVDGFRDKTWTLFIVGRRNHAQNTYAIKPQRVG